MKPLTIPLLVGLAVLMGACVTAGGRCAAADSASADATSASTADAVAARIDRLIEDAWDQADLQPAARSDDAEFFRRLWFDFAGVAPPVADVRSFLADRRPNKRAEWIDRLSGSPRWASQMANRWRDILLPEAPAPERQGDAVALQQWLRRQFAQNVGYDDLVASFLTAGGTSDPGPAAFYTALDVQPDKVAAATSRIFLGQQLQCAQCHDHPFDDWTQHDFWAFAAFFAQLAQTTRPLAGGGTMIIDRRDGEVHLPDTEQVVTPLYPGKLDAAGRVPERDPAGNRRRQLTVWLASRDNPYFARAAANRVWAHLMGIGLVEPVDAMDRNNPASHPEVLDVLTEHFIATRFDLRQLYRAIARTRVYQLSSVTQGARPPATSLAAMQVKTLTADQFYDTLQQNVLRRRTAAVGPTMAGIDPVRSAFVGRMRAIGSTPRDYPHGVVQALALMNGPEITAATGASDSGLLIALDAPFFTDAARVETLFLATLSRPPTAPQSERFHALLSAAEDDQQRHEAMSDMLWALISSAEFAMCP